MYTYPAAQGERAPSNGKIDPIPYDFGVSYVSSNQYQTRQERAYPHLREFDPKSFSEGISRFTPVKIPYRPPTDWKPIISAFIAILTVSLGYRVALPLLLNRWFWAILSIGSSLIFISGIMFVRIRGNPYVAAGSNGAQWIAPGYQNQFGMEVQVVAFICMTSFSALPLLHPLTPKSRWHPYLFIPFFDTVRTSITYEGSSDVGCRHLVWRDSDRFLCANWVLQVKERRCVSMFHSLR